MKILIAPDSFKNSLPAKEVALAMKRGAEQVFPNAEFKILPLSDGGEGWTDSWLLTCGGRKVKCKVQDPLGRSITAYFALLPNKTAIIEVAAASGLERLTKAERNPLYTSTFGTGQLIKEALALGSKKVILGLGGSATNDGGVGMAKALGYEFYNGKGDLLAEGGQALLNLNHIESKNKFVDTDQCEFVAACDVINPLFGPNGASQVYGVQKGASLEEVLWLDQGMRQLAMCMGDDEIAKTRGAGAAGGMGAGVIFFLKGKLVSGFEMIAQATRLEKLIQEADFLLSGEGAIDAQSLEGKLVYRLTKMAHGNGKPIVLGCGQMRGEKGVWERLGCKKIFSLVDANTTEAEALKETADLLEKRTKQTLIELFK